MRDNNSKKPFFNKGKENSDSSKPFKRDNYKGKSGDTRKSKDFGSSKFDPKRKGSGKEEDDFSDFKDPNRVKAVYNSVDGQCLYFSRSPVPYAREAKDLAHWHQHIGVYCYQTQALEDFCSLSEGELEKIEKLEQLRALGAGMRIGATIIDHELIGVDTPEDIERVEGVLK